MKAHHLGGAVSLAAGLDKEGHNGHDHDPDAPADAPDDSHDWVILPRWWECRTCGARDHWPSASAPCSGASAPKDQPVGLEGAVALLRADLERFRLWWLEWAHALGLERPSLNEWGAEFASWRARGKA